MHKSWKRTIGIAAATLGILMTSLQLNNTLCSYKGRHQYKNHLPKISWKVVLSMHLTQRRLLPLSSFARTKLQATLQALLHQFQNRV